MATKSIMKTVKISNTPFCHSFADAIDKTKSMKQPEVHYKSECRDLKKENVKAFFEKQ